MSELKKTSSNSIVTPKYTPTVKSTELIDDCILLDSSELVFDGINEIKENLNEIRKVLSKFKKNEEKK